MAQVDEPGLPPQTLRLKIGAKVMLTRNISTRFRMCNGTPAIVTNCSPDVVTIRRIEADGSLSDEIDIVRYPFERKADATNKKGFKFNRFQFPIKPAYALTIHKSQGQTVNKMGLLLNSNPFTHGQLYTSMTRVTELKDIIVCNLNTSNGDPADVVRNVVHPNVTKFVIELEGNSNEEN